MRNTKQRRDRKRALFAEKMRELIQTSGNIGSLEFMIDQIAETLIFLLEEK